MIREKLLIDFSSPVEESRWEIVNDVVMGGVSKSKIFITAQGTAVFQGKLSMENYGGFASVRTYPQSYALSGYHGLMIRVKSDGKTYRLRLRTDDDYDGIGFQAYFTTDNDEWAVVSIPFSAFVPVFRGRVVAGMPDLDIRSVRRIGFMIADKQEGHFCLEIAWVKAYAESP